MIFPSPENSSYYIRNLPHPSSLYPPPPLVMGVVAVCHCGDVGTLQAMMTQHPKVDVTMTTEGEGYKAHHYQNRSGVTHVLYIYMYTPTPPHVDKIVVGGVW